MQTVRFESVELSQQLEASRKEQEMNEEMTAEEDWEAQEESSQVSKMNDKEYELGVRWVYKHCGDGGGGWVTQVFPAYFITTS